MKFIIEKFPLLPEQIVRVPNGHVIFTGFVGDTAYAWVQIQLDAEGVMADELMGLVAVANGGPYELDGTDEFYPAYHVSSFLRRSRIKINANHETGVAFHCFCWKPKTELPLMN